LGAYLGILRRPQTARMVTAMLLGRLPNGMFPLGVVFVLRGSSGSYSAAGAALAALMVGTTCSAPLRGRAVDRWGQSRLLPCLVLAQAAAMAAFLLAVSTAQNTLTVAALIAAVGATSSTLGGAMRRTWPALVPSADELPAAYALQALLEDLISVVGPLLASLLLMIASPTTVLICGEIAALAGTTAFAAAPASRGVTRRSTRRCGRLGALGTPGMRTLVLTLGTAGMAVGMLYIAVPAFVSGRGSASAGVLLAVMAASSIVSGLWYGARRWASSVDRRYIWLAGMFAAAASLLALAGTAVQLGVTLSLVGIAYAPRMISAYALLDDLAPHDSLAEAYTWLVSASAGGIALGSAMAGPLVQHAGARWAFAGAGVCAVTGFATVVVRHRTIESPEHWPQHLGGPTHRLGIVTSRHGPGCR
jgi:MFS family permease